MQAIPRESSRERPLVSVILPAYNEAAVLEQNLGEIAAYLRQLEHSYRFEILLINDGSRDTTAQVADFLRERFANLRVIHHPSNFGLGQAFKTAFAESRGDYVVTMDVDLSYSPEHVGTLLETISSTRAKLVLASPYMRGGRLTNVPWLRKTMSIWGNRFLRIFARSPNVSTITCMVRAYDGPFIRSMILRSTGMEIMPEVVYKTMILRGRIEQVPGHLDWTKQLAAGPRRTSSMRILKHVFSTVLSGFVFRPFMFLVMPGLLLLLFSAYVNAWMFIHFFNAMAQLPPEARDATVAFAQAYAAHPHTFIVALLSLMLAVQLIGLGIVALQSKRYFEEIYYLGVSLRRSIGHNRDS
ncbi:MAG: glycosyltransferase family 2 protein [Steroidobacteraceae bacterium]